MQCIGTAATSPPKKRALSSRVRALRVLMRVRDANEEVGSLNPMWPFAPMPSSCRSTPPAARIAAS